MNCKNGYCNSHMMQQLVLKEQSLGLSAFFFFDTTLNVNPNPLAIGDSIRDANNITSTAIVAQLILVSGTIYKVITSNTIGDWSAVTTIEDLSISATIPITH